MINQDEGVSPTDIERALQTAGLLDLVYRGSLGPFPTLRAMIDSNQRLVVMAENDAGAVPWYHLAYEHALQETPFRFTNAAALTEPGELAASCRPNRGPLGTAVLAQSLGRHDAGAPPVARRDRQCQRALARARPACQRIRDRLPNLVAVDCYGRGDVLGVVDTLNGVAR